MDHGTFVFLSLCLLNFLLLSSFGGGVECCSSSDAHDEYRVVRKSDSDGKQLEVAVGEDAKLSCQTNVKWKKCYWKPPRNGVRQVKNFVETVNVKKRTCIRDQ